MAAAGCAGLLATAACGGEAPAQPRFTDPPAATTAAPADPTTPAASGVRAPLTGLPVTEQVAARPLLAVPVGASPRGLDRADVVVEELSSPVRYLAMFQSRDAADVGPVGQTRPVDAQVLAVGKTAIGYAGGKQGFVDQLRTAGILDVGTAAAPAAYRSSGGAVFTSTAALFGQVRGATAAPPLLSFGDPGAPFAARGALAAKDVTITPPGSAAQRWTWVPQSRAWQRADLRLRFTNVILQEVAYKDIEPVARSRATVPSARVLGTGRCTVLSGASAVGCTWLRKGGPQGVTNYLDATNTPLRLVPGSTWVVLVPAGTKVSRA